MKLLMNKDYLTSFKGNNVGVHKILKIQSRIVVLLKMLRMKMKMKMIRLSGCRDLMKGKTF